MHVLVIPSEEFVPQRNHAIGIFQYHQAKIMMEHGYKVGALSVTQAFSIPMLLKALIYKITMQKTGNVTDSYSFNRVLGVLYSKLFAQQKYLQEDNIEGIPVFRIEGFYYLSPSDYSNMYGWVKAGMTAFDNYVAKYGVPDIVHAHNVMYAGILAKKIKEKYNVQYVITEHSTLFARNMVTDSMLLSALAQAYKYASGVYAVSKPFCKLLSGMFRGIDFQYLPNVIDPYLEKQSFTAIEKNCDEIVFLNIAELHPKKNHQLLLEAFAQLKNDAKHKNAKLWIAGSGVEHDNIIETITMLHLQNDVKMLGLLNRDEVLQAIKDCTAVVLSSDYETFGVVLIESMLFGKPVIATKCGGPESFVNDSCGILVDKQDKNQLSNAMGKLIANIHTYNPQQIRDYTLQEFGEKRFFKDIEKIYSKALC